MTGIRPRDYHFEVTHHSVCTYTHTHSLNSLINSIEMGIVFGRTGCAEPVYNVLASRSSYEIREYESFIVASVNMAKNNEDNSFNTLAKYIGVFGTPENRQKEPMAMTAPVLFENNKNGEEMSFVLPFHMQHVNDVPAPLNRNIKIDKQTKKVLAVKSFSG